MKELVAKAGVALFWQVCEVSRFLGHLPQKRPILVEVSVFSGHLTHSPWRKLQKIVISAVCARCSYCYAADADAVQIAEQ